MKNIVISFLIIISIFIITGCSLKNYERNNSFRKQKEDIIDSNNLNEVNKSMKIIINDKEYVLKLENNTTAEEFVKLLPQEFIMNDLNNNEKYANMDKTLTTNPYYPKRISKGDVMLYGDNCLVIFYKTFDTNYRYTKIGYIDNLENLGDKSITVRFGE